MNKKLSLAILSTTLIHALPVDDTPDRIQLNYYNHSKPINNNKPTKSRRKVKLARKANLKRINHNK